MATVEECEQAFHELAAKLAGADDNAKKQPSLNRSVSCKLRDLNVIFLGELKDGQLTDIRQVDRPDAQVRLSMTSDVLLELTSGRRSFASAWLSGAVTVDANVFDLLKLRSIL
jgi:alkyl sulfatase BDS1-like metallo-beta-lactamase superfamily hydrolase